MRSCRVDRAGRILLLAMISGLEAAPAAAQLAPIESNPAVLSMPRQLRLEVFINGVSTHLIEPFIWTPPGRLTATRGDLEDVGIKIAGQGGLRDFVVIDDLPGLRFHYDEAAQQIDFLLTDSERLARVYDARGHGSRPPPPSGDWGAVVNYTAYAASANALSPYFKFSGANLTLDARAFSPWGTLSQTAIVGNNLVSDADYLRLDSTYTFSSPDSLLSGRIGDTISGGLAWTRPIRLGGVQLQRDFTLRSDLVTQPTPVITGSAAVPSTVDVFLNNIRAFSQPVGPGPYQIVNLPVVANSGTARVVVTDASGRQVESSLPFYSSPILLGGGLTDFSLDGGFARRYYALLSDDYAASPVATATLRYGLFDALTLEGHAEGGDRLENAGVGTVTRLGPWGTLSTASAFSQYEGAIGCQLYGAYNVQLWNVGFNLSSQRTFNRYNDLASVTAAQPQPGSADFLSAARYGLVPAVANLDPRPPKVLDQISFGVPLPLARTSLSASFVNLVDADDTRSRVVAASLTQQLPGSASLYATFFVDLAQHNGVGLFAGLSIPFGADINASAGGSTGAGAGRNANVDVQKTLQNQDGSYGWHVRDVEGTTPYREADASYRSGYGTVKLTAQQESGSFGGSGQIDGSVAMLGGGVFFGNHIRDGFAVVDAGVPNIDVLQDNRPIGSTNPWGKLLVPDLRSYQTNKITIDPSGLPSTAEADSTQKIVAPARQGGVYVDFGVTKDVQAAIVILTKPNGKFLPPGSKGRLDGSGETFIVGYDGQAYVKHLAASNTIVAENDEAECRASFSYNPVAGKRVVIGPITCQ